MKYRTWIHATLIVEIAAFGALPLAHGHDMAEHQHTGHAAAPEDHSAHMAQAAANPLPESVSVTLSNQPLNDQDGHSRRLKSELIGDHIAVVTFVYTSCTAVCPVVSGIMADLQKKLGERLDKDVRLVSLSVDPARDTPSRLKSYAAQFDARPGWFWLTGSTANVTEALTGFGAYTANFENHPVIVMIGDGRTGQWSRHYGLSNPDKLLAQVDRYLASRQSASYIKAVGLAKPRDGGG